MAVMAGVQNLLNSDFFGPLTQRQDAIDGPTDLRLALFGFRNKASDRPAVAGYHDGFPMLDVIE